MKKHIMLLGLVSALLLTGCGGGSKPEEEGPTVFVFSGQSNMEGNTNFGNDGAY